MEAFKVFLQQKLSPKTADIHAKNIQQFLIYLEQQALDIQYCNTVLIHDYLLRCRKKGWQTSTIRLHLCSLRYYLDFRHIHPNPALAVRLEKQHKSLPIGLWSVAEIIELYQFYPSKYLRNKLVLSLLCFQALRKGEVERLKVQDIRWQEKQLIIQKYKKTNERTLTLEVHQIELLRAFCEDKKKAIFEAEQVNFAINALGRALKKKRIDFGFHRLRASVYNNWLDKYNLRQVQYMAGHRYLSSTERYQTQHLEALQIELEKYYPLQAD